MMRPYASNSPQQWPTLKPFPWLTGPSSSNNSTQLSLEPGLEAVPNTEAVKAIEDVLRAHDIPYTMGMTWTTDAPYRETPKLVKQRREEGCLTVEMEAASLFAVAAFRKVPLAQIIYGGDDVSGEEWDTRNWKERTSIREQLFWLAAEACVKL